MGAWVRGDDVVTLITSYGEGTSNQGEIHEAMNFAGVHKLPVIFVCENNGYAISVPLDKQVGRRPRGGPRGGLRLPRRHWSTASDPLACYAAAKEAHDRARAGEGPTLIEARVVRLTSHSSDDDQRRYRDAAEVEALKEQDPDRALRRPAARDGACSTTSGTRSCGPRPRPRSTRPAVAPRRDRTRTSRPPQLHVYAEDDGQGA